MIPDINADIIAAESIGGIQLGSDSREVLGLLDKTHNRLSCLEYVVGDFLCTQVTLDHVGLSFVHDEGNRIIGVTCRPPYAGRYRQKFYPGITVGKLRELAGTALVIHGYIIVDKEFGVLFSIPEKYAGKFYDDIDAIEQLPSHMALNEILVRDREWWR